MTIDDVVEAISALQIYRGPRGGVALQPIDRDKVAEIIRVAVARLSPDTAIVDWLGDPMDGCAHEDWVYLVMHTATPDEFRAECRKRMDAAATQQRGASRKDAYQQRLFDAAQESR